MEMYLIDIVNTYPECFVLKFLDIVYCLYWCEAYETMLAKSLKKLGVVLFLLLYCSHRWRLLLQSMQNSSKSYFEKKIKLINWITFDTWSDAYIKIWLVVPEKLVTFMDTIFNFCTISKYFSCVNSAYIYMQPEPFFVNTYSFSVQH